LDPNNVKAYYRANKASTAVEKYEQSIQFCNDGLAKYPTNKELKETKIQAQKRLEEMKKKDLEKQESLKQKQGVQNLIKTKGIRIGSYFFSSMTQYLASGSSIYVDEMQNLHFPVLLLYEEHNQTDFIQDFDESHTFQQHIIEIFPGGKQFCPWDTGKKYVHHNLEIYFISNAVKPLQHKGSGKRKRKIKVRQTSTLRKVLLYKEYVVPGFPVFYIVVKGSKFKEEFLKRPIKSFYR